MPVTVQGEAICHTGVRCAYTLQEPGAAPAPVKPPPTDDDALDDSKFDEFMGSDAGAFASFGEYDQVYCVCCCCLPLELSQPKQHEVHTLHVSVSIKTDIKVLGDGTAMLDVSVG